MLHRVRMPSIAYVVARSAPGHVIGCENRLPWKLKTDLRFFRSVTEGHAIIMGRKTYDSIGFPLKNRQNIVLSRTFGNDAHNLFWVSSVEEALFIADFYSILQDRTQILIIGGSEIYRVFSSKGLVNKVFLTEVFEKFDSGDAFFEEKFDRRQWKTVDEHDYPASQDDEFRFRITILERRRKYVRQRDPREFLTFDKGASDWARAQVLQKAPLFEALPAEQISLPFG